MIVGWAVILAAQMGTLSTLDRESACKAASISAEGAYEVRGRLYTANGGGSGYRIVVPQTKRILWVTTRIDPAVPDEIARLFKPFDEELEGRFLLAPIVKDKPGVMRQVCFVSASDVKVRRAKR